MEIKSKSTKLILALLLGLLMSGICAAQEPELLHPALKPQAHDAPLDYPVINYGTGTKAEQIKRGEYAAKAGDCIACHTQKEGKAFAGGLPIKTPFGTFYSPNITPDKKTGIGNWTDEQFVRSMHEGIRPDGSNNFPVFPYLYFNKVSTQDLMDIKAYMDAVPAVNQENRKNDVPWPFSWRLPQMGWKLLFFDFYKGEFKPDPKQSSTWNRGAYLVEGLGHCAMCHTPINILGGPKRKYAYRGGAMVDGYYVPDITGDNLKDASIQDIVNVFKKNEMIGSHAQVRGPMADVNRNSLRYLNDEDLRSMAIYLKTIKSPPLHEATTGGGKVDSGTGKNVYASHCAACHDTGASEAPKLGDPAAWTNRIAQGVDVLYKNAIQGIRGMPAKGTCMTCSDDEIKAAVDYIKDKFSGAESLGTMALTKLPAPKKLGLEDGKKTYEQVCSICHAEGKLGAPKIGDTISWAPRIQKNMDVLFKHVIQGYNNMPAKGACPTCSNADIIAAVKYIVEQSKPEGDYNLW